MDIMDKAYLKYNMHLPGKAEVLNSFQPKLANSLALTQIVIDKNPDNNEYCNIIQVIYEIIQVICEYCRETDFGGKKDGG